MFFGSKIMHLLVFFVLFWVETVFLGPGSMGLEWRGVGGVLMQFMYFSAIFAMLAVLAALVTVWYPL